MADPILTVAQAAADLGLSTRTVRRYLQKGRLAGTKQVVGNGLAEWQIEPGSVRNLKAELAGQAGRTRPAAKGAGRSDATAAEVRAMNQRLAELTQVMAGIVAGYAETQKLLPAAAAELSQARAETSKVAQERDEAQRRAEGLQAENQALREALTQQQRASWWQRLFGANRSKEADRDGHDRREDQVQ